MTQKGVCRIDVVGRVRNGETPPFRPRVPPGTSVEPVDSRLVDLMQQCWLEDPAHRPTVSTVLTRFTDITQIQRKDLMDNLLEMMEKHTSNLESVIEERTHELSAEKVRIDRLLYNMMPASVADGLKTGIPVKPQLFVEASVSFVVIYNFNVIVSKMTPVQVVDLVNHLWITFDDIAAKHDVYKVETISESYMVSSGVPNFNANHAVDMANMALDILMHLPTYNEHPQLPTVDSAANATGAAGGHVRVCIGINSGPVVGAVIGMTMPRYCLFGDTVNVASRLQSTGEPQRVHISERTYYALMQFGTRYALSKRGQIILKGKEGLTTTYWLDLQ